MANLASVDPIHQTNAWSAKGAAGDAMQRVEHQNPICCIWLNTQGEIKWSKANTNFQTLAMFTAVLQEFAQSCIREDLK